MDNWLLSSLFQNRGMLDAAIVLGLFWAALSRPKRIHHLGLFRCAVIFYCLALITPTLNQLVIFIFNGPGIAPGIAPGMGRPAGAMNTGAMTISWFLACVPVLLTAMALYCAIEAIRPRDYVDAPPAKEPAKADAY